MNNSGLAVEAVQWRARVRQLTEDCICGLASEQAQRLDDMRALQEGAPPEVIAQFVPLSSQVEFARMIAVQAWESAVLSLIGPRAAFICSRGGSGLYIATLVMPGSNLEHGGEGASFALALLAAIGEAMLATAGEFAR